MSFAHGIMLPRDLPANLIVPFAVEAERVGFDEIWVVEDCFFRGGIAQAAVVLTATTTIAVGIGILPAAPRNPVFTTLEAATLAELFPGRLTLGIGHGMPSWMRQIGEWPASPLTLLSEHLTTIKALLAGETVTRTGRYVSLDNIVLESAPPVIPPVLAGVRGPKSLALAGRAADGVILAEPVTPEYLRVALAHVADGREKNDASGESELTSSEIRVVTYNVGAVDDDADVARALARPALEWIGDSDWAPHITPLPFAEEFAAHRAAAASREEFAASLPPEWVDQLALVGTPARVRSRIAELREAGATSVVFIAVGSDPLAAVRSLGRVIEPPTDG
jgi:5,10-methylenetetrahydromethanopterin reductase